MIKTMLNCLETRLFVLICLTTYYSHTQSTSVYANDGGKQCECVFYEYEFKLTLSCTHPVSAEIRDCFESHPTTRHLLFTKSRLKIIPRELGVLNNVEVIDLSHNFIKELDFTQLEHICRNIKQLVLNYNRIKVLRSGKLDCFCNLKELSLANNTLEDIEDGAFNYHLLELEHLYMPYNDLVRFDISLAVLPRFMKTNNVVVNVSYNRIGIITNSIGISIENISTSHTAFIDFIHNNFTSVDIQHYIQLFSVKNVMDVLLLRHMGFDFRFNPFICDCSFYPIATLVRDFYWVDPNNALFMVTCYNPINLRGRMVSSVPENQFNCTVSLNCPHGCNCTETIALDFVTVYCAEDYNKTRLPETVPSQKQIVLRMHIPNLEQLDGRPYMVNVTTLDVSNSALRNIDTSLLSYLDDITSIDLRDNIMTELPEEIQYLNFTNIETLRLSGNPYACDCHTLWLKKWLIQRQDHIPSQEKIICATGPGKGRPVIHVQDADFVCSTSTDTELHVALYETISIVCGVLFIVSVISFTMHYNRTSIQLLMIAHLGIHCFRRKVKSNLKYDVFVSHSSKDDAFVWNVLKPMLENANPPFVLCLDERNFRPGETIVHNVITAMETSLTTLLVLSNNFLNSDWCRLEFRKAHMNLLKDGTNVVMMVLGDIDNALIDDNSELKHYMNTNVYIKYVANDRYFWPKLLQSLPIRQQDKSSSPVSPCNVYTVTHDSSLLLPNSSCR